jgi:uncharacterized membrane protein YqjE
MKTATMAATPAAAAGPLPYDGWELDEQLRHIERVLMSNKLRGEPAAAGEPAEQAEQAVSRADWPHASVPAWHVQPAARPARRPPPRKPARRGRGLGLLIGMAMSLGPLAVVGGGALLAWSLWSGREDLRIIAAPTALAGQVLVLLGLVLQLHRLTRDSRQAAGKLDRLDQDIHELRTTTTLLGTTHGPTAAAFYAHLAGGASPRILLSDLKSQLDILAMKLGNS